MDGAALIFCGREHFSHCFQHTQTFVFHNESHAVQSADFKPLEETNPAGFVILHVLVAHKTSRYPSSFTAIATRIATFFVFPTLVTLQAVPYTSAALQRTITPIFGVNVGFIIQFANGGLRNPTLP